MRIVATSGSAHVEIDRRDEGGYAFFDVSAQLPDFSGRNRGIVLLDAASFLNRLEEFEASRSGMAVLKGSDDFKFWIEALDKAGHVGVGFGLSKQLYLGYSKASMAKLEGGFEYDSGSVGQLLQAFRSLLRGEHPSSVR